MRLLVLFFLTELTFHVWHTTVETGYLLRVSTVKLLPLRLTWLFAVLGQSLSGDLVRQEVESITGYVPQGEGQPSSEQTPESVLLQDDGNTVDGSTVSVNSCLILQTHLHQVNGCTNKHLKADQVKESVHQNEAMRILFWCSNVLF